MEIISRIALTPRIVQVIVRAARFDASSDFDSSVTSFPVARPTRQLAELVREERSDSCAEDCISAGGFQRGVHEFAIGGAERLASFAQPLEAFALIREGLLHPRAPVNLASHFTCA